MHQVSGILTRALIFVILLKKKRNERKKEVLQSYLEAMKSKFFGQYRLILVGTIGSIFCATSDVSS